MVEKGSLSGFPTIEDAHIDAIVDERAANENFMEDLTAHQRQIEPNFLHLLGLRADPAFETMSAAFAVAGALTVWRILQDIDPNLPEAILSDVPEDKFSLSTATYRAENDSLMRFLDDTEERWPDGSGRYFRIGALTAYEMKRRAFERTRKRIN